MFTLFPPLLTPKTAAQKELQQVGLALLEARSASEHWQSKVQSLSATQRRLEEFLK